MSLIDVFKNEIKAAVGYQQTFEELIANGDVRRAIGMMEDRSIRAMECIREYQCDSHKIMKRKPKVIRDKQGNVVRSKELNKIAIPYPLYINEIALVFMYGRPPKWIDGTPAPHRDERVALDEERKTLQEGDPRLKKIDDRIAVIQREQDRITERFKKYTDLMTDARFDAHIREAKRAAGIEECSAMLFHCYKEDGQPKMKIKVLSKMENDDIYTMFDQYGRLVAFAWGYNTVDASDKTLHHYDIYMNHRIWRCSQHGFGQWNIKAEDNPIGKIPVIVFLQKREWEQTTSLIDRVEKAMSSVADSNDRFSDPKLVATSEVLNKEHLPKDEEDGDMFVVKAGGDVHYLERTDSNEARSSEIDKLDDQILSKSFTPNLTLESLKGLGQASGRMLEQYLILANIKADKHKEKHDEYLSRTSNLVLAILDNVLDIPNRGYSELVVLHEFSEPFGEDVSQILSDATKQHNAGGMSTETYLEHSYLIKDKNLELERLEREKQEKLREYQMQQKMDAFGLAD